MALGKKALGEFLRVLAAAPDGTLCQVGDCWTAQDGWRPYFLIGGKMLAMSPGKARKLVETARKLARKPGHQAGFESLKRHFEALAESADDCERKNRERVIPEDAALMLPPAGRA